MIAAEHTRQDRGFAKDRDQPVWQIGILLDAVPEAQSADQAHEAAAALRFDFNDTLERLSCGIQYLGFRHSEAASGRNQQISWPSPSP
jgi:hypothetical protein